LLTDDNISAAVKAFFDVHATAAESLARVTAQARADIADFFECDEQGRPVRFSLEKGFESGTIHQVRKLKPVGLTGEQYKIEMDSAADADALLLKANGAIRTGSWVGVEVMPGEGGKMRVEIEYIDVASPDGSEDD
jgi:hypothetical protein